MVCHGLVEKFKQPVVIMVDIQNAAGFDMEAELRPSQYFKKLLQRA
jgi:hypothetical protein